MKNFAPKAQPLKLKLAYQFAIACLITTLILTMLATKFAHVPLAT
jgi:hypothetical protein